MLANTFGFPFTDSFCFPAAETWQWGLPSFSLTDCTSLDLYKSVCVFVSVCVAVLCVCIYIENVFCVYRVLYSTFAFQILV